jgi:hypothetical protein
MFCLGCSRSGDTGLDGNQKHQRDAQLKRRMIFHFSQSFLLLKKKLLKFNRLLAFTLRLPGDLLSPPIKTTSQVNFGRLQRSELQSVFV